jgi:hypothetical protein
MSTQEFKTISSLPAEIISQFSKGCVIPAHPLALTKDRQLDEKRQVALSRYYIDAGVGGLAVGVHTTQIAIREHGLYQPVLKLAADTARQWTDRAVMLIAGVSGKTEQAKNEAITARKLGYHAALLNVAALNDSSETQIIEHCREIANEMPLIGFYLLPECGGRHLSYDFWRAFCQLDNVLGIKVAAFNRYGTINVVRALVDTYKEEEITLYTGNDDTIVHDLVMPFLMRRQYHGGSESVTVRFKGGLLGHWSVWTKKAVALLARIHQESYQEMIPADLLALDSIVTDSNAAIYDGKHQLAGCIPGCLSVLVKQGLLENITCLDEDEKLSPGQKEEIERVCDVYPELNDDAFVKENLARWLS